MLYFIACLALIAAGAMMLANLRLVYDLTERWKHDGGAGEPSRLYLWNTRLGGAMCALAGAGGVIVTFIPK